MEKRILTLVLAAAFLLSSVSCAGNEENGKETQPSSTNENVSETESETESEPENAELRPELPEKDYGGSTFTYLRYDLTEQTITYLANDLCPTGETGDTLNDSIWRRNSVVEDKYKIKFAEDVDRNCAKVLGQMLGAQELKYDAVNPELLQLKTMVLSGYLMNLYDLPVVDWTYPWWDSSSVKSLTIRETLPAVFTDITLVDKYSTYVTLFHKGMAQDHNLPDLYELTSEGKWTLDNMISLSESVSEDINGDGKYDKNDVYGISAQKDAMYVLMHGSGVRFADTDENGDPIDVFYSERTVDAAKKIISLMGDERLFFDRTAKGLTVPECINMFAANQALFFLRPLTTVESLRDMENDYGIIPIPKYAESDENYRCTMNKWIACPMAVPLTVRDAEYTGIILEALAAESHYGVIPSFYEDVLGAKIVRDPESSEMLDLVFDSRMYDIGYIYDFGGFCDKLMNIPKGKKSGITGLYNSNKSAIAASINDFIENAK